MGFFCIFYFLLFQCAFRHQPLLLKYFFVFKLGSCHFPHKRGVQEEKSEFVHCFGRWPATCRDFISPPCSGPAWFGLVFFFGRCLQAPWLIGRPPGGRGGGTHRRFRKEKQSSSVPQQALFAFILIYFPFSWRGMSSRDDRLCEVLGRHGAVASGFFLFLLLHPLFC